MTEKNLAVIGAGYWGKNLVRNFHQLGVLKTICDPLETTGRMQAEEEVEAKTPELAETLRAMRVLLGEGYIYVNDGRTDRARFATDQLDVRLRGKIG